MTVNADVVSVSVTSTPLVYADVVTVAVWSSQVVNADVIQVKLTSTPFTLARVLSVNVASTSPVSAGADVSNIEPGSTQTLTGTGQGNGTWTQLSGATVKLIGTGATVTYVAPATDSGSALVFQYAEGTNTDTCTHTVLFSTEQESAVGALTPSALYLA